MGSGLSTSSGLSLGHAASRGNIARSTTGDLDWGGLVSLDTRFGDRAFGFGVSLPPMAYDFTPVLPTRDYHKMPINSQQLTANLCVVAPPSQARVLLYPHGPGCISTGVYSSSTSVHTFFSGISA